MRRALLTLAVVGLVIASGVRVCAALLPERFAVNAPLRLLLGAGIAAPSEDTVAARLRPPAGARVSLFATDVPNARFLRFTPTGDLLVSQPREGRIVRLAPDRDGDGRSDGRSVVLSGLNRPHGIELRDRWLYVAETDAVGRAPYDVASGSATGPFERVVTGIPAGGGHWTRTIRFGPDGWFYLSIGSSCNVCLEQDARRASIIRFRPDGSGQEIYATGLRNAVGFDWRPEDGQLYATDNGRDLLGDDFPPCELNQVRQGGFYGWPVANGNRVPDPDFGKGQEARIAVSIPPVHGFRAHNAPLGITFLRGPGVPESYRGAALVALHGSWNRTRKDGYKVVSLHWGDDGIEERDFLTGFLGANEDVIGRPVDVAEGPDGAVYVSDDAAGAIYRVAWGGAAGATAAAVPATATAPPTYAAVAFPAAAVARGKALYEQTACAACHEAEHPPQGVVPRRLAGLSKKYDAASLASYLKTPNPPMPAFPFSDQERSDLAAFLLTVHP